MTTEPPDQPTRLADYDSLPRDLDGFPYRISSNTAIRVTTCCGAYPTYHDTTLCCRACWHEVDPDTDRTARLDRVVPLRPEPPGPHRYRLPPDPPRPC